MKNFDPKTASVDELIARFLELSIEQYEMEMSGHGTRRNRAVRARFAVEDALQERDGDARRLLVRFYEHANVQVQCNAASATLALFPEEARRRLEHIRRWTAGVTKLEAGMRLWAIDTGRYVPK